MKKNVLIVVLALAIVTVAGLTFAGQAPATQEAKVTITPKGFEPASLKLKADVPAKITFLRTTDATCATEVALPEYKIQKALPLNKPVVIEITPKKGSFDFVCGMNMLRGKIVVQ